MNRTGLAILAGTFFAVGAAAQSEAGAQAGGQASSQTNVEASQQGANASTNGAASAAGSAQTEHGSAALANGTAFNAALDAPLDSKKAKPGDAVTAHTTEAAKSDGKTVLPKGTKLVGHVTQASARGKGDAESALGIAFDKAILKNGQEVPVNVAIQAIAEGQASAAAAGSELDAVGSSSAAGGGSARSGGGHVLGGVTGAAGGTVGTVSNTAADAGGTAAGALNSTVNTTGSVAGATNGAVGGLNSVGQLSSNSRGVFGLNGLNLNSAASNSTQGSVITSARKNVHLDSGTRMLLVSGAAAGMQDDAKQPASKKP
ncbi:MAG: hypothetical protein PVS2B2_05700 [Candidatus Acidiferrum sp.]